MIVRLSEEHFDATYYTTGAFWKISVFMFNIVPYLALRIVGVE